MIIQSLNNFTLNTPKTYLSSSISSGTSIIPLRNVNDFNPLWAIQIGETGQQQTEILNLTSGVPSGTLGTTATNTSFDHTADTPVYGIKYDQIVFGRSTAGTLGTAVPLGTVNIQANGSMTYFDDVSGSSTYAYKTYLRSSSLAVNATESDWITPQGFTPYMLGKIRQRIKDKLVSSGYISGIQVDDSMINDWINEWLEVMTNTAIDVNEGYSMGTFQIAYTGQNDLGTITAQDFKQLERVWYIDASGTFQATKQDDNSFSPNKTYSVTYPYFSLVGDAMIRRRPNDADGTLLCQYYKLSPQLIEDTDQLPQSMWGYTKAFVDYGHAQALFKDQKTDESGMKLQETSALLDRFRKEITPRSKTGATYIDIVEDTAADQELWL